jgi:hypothetical protein
MTDTFIADNGREVECRNAETGSLVQTLPRDGVCKLDAGKGKPQCVEVGADLEALREKCGDVPVFTLDQLGRKGTMRQGQDARRHDREATKRVLDAMSNEERRAYDTSIREAKAVEAQALEELVP